MKLLQKFDTTFLTHRVCVHDNLHKLGIYKVTNHAKRVNK